MAATESNPIQQRMELFVEKWEAVIANPEVKMVRIHALENEKDMVSAFYTYLLGVDTNNHDIPIIFNSIFYDGNQYSVALLDELKDMIDTWNRCTKDDVEVAIQHLDWQVDYSISDIKIPPYSFIENINALASFLKLPDGVHLVPILRVSYMSSGDVIQWLNQLLKLNIHEKVKLMIDDSVANSVYDSLIEKNQGKAVTIIPDMNMDAALQQVAAMGNPNDPAVQYRKAFLSMMQGIEKRKEGDAVKYADECIAIANKNIEKNPYWIGQLIAVNAALANDQVGYKNFKKAISYSTRGVEAALNSKEIVTDEYVHRKFIAQAIMLRGSLYAADKNWNNAIMDYDEAVDHYIYTNDTILALEAFRMISWCNHKNGDNDSACVALADAVDMSKQVPKNILKFTTFAGIIELLLDINNFKYITNNEVAQAAEEVYGDEWMKEISNWKNPKYQNETDPEQAMSH